MCGTSLSASASARIRSTTDATRRGEVTERHSGPHALAEPSPSGEPVAAGEQVD
ncbi:hypothetical protein [Nocardia farcinica]|uniref:hypothetical protein n=1 Tax=Nocardia farcinica TaxID=37329 RepID=UPI002458C868|nr:hypothetical protein [Nocardia farcinica]